MKQEIERYSLQKKLICKGVLETMYEGQLTTLNYTDDQINISVSELYHPIAALESLRKILESKYNSVLAINGCRIDSSYRATGHSNNYIIETGKQSTFANLINMFDPTNEIDKLTTIKEHKIAYRAWAESLGAK